jgi:predicted lactoylglutathione lyase
VFFKQILFMSRQVYINLPVKDLSASTKFYQDLGFTLNPDFSDENASAVTWSDDIIFMLLTHDFYKKFTSKNIPDLTQNTACLIAISLDSREAVQKFADTAKANGGSYFEAEPNKGLDFMFGLEVTDLDGHTLEPVFMDLSKLPGAGN